MRVAEPALAAWRAELELEFRRDAERTILARRRHDGPLLVQKPLYPEGDAVCHAIVVHPPGGIAGGDELEISVRACERAHALLTTPGAGKWYRSAGSRARQRISFEAAPGTTIEWLPQETIVFDGAAASLRTEVRLAGDARYVGWDVLCLGRTGSGERFARGECRIATEIRRDGKLVWLERGRVEGGGSLLESPAGLQGRSVAGTMLAAAPELPPELVQRCRPAIGDALALTLLPGVLCARYLGESSEAAKRGFARLWSLLRPVLCGREAVEPRIWRT